MSNYEERVAEAVKLCAGGNREAHLYLNIICRSARLIDNLFDNLNKWQDEDTYDLSHLLLVELPDNPFFIANRHSLLPLHLVALNAWKDSNSWETEEGVKRTYALVIRDTLTEVGLMVAHLVGGRDYLEEVSLKVRELFIKEEF
tara:strand:+ start:303 stop:734 length:432 start_codon:yes stop_codon:yes gene_type:complete